MLRLLIESVCWSAADGSTAEQDTVLLRQSLTNVSEFQCSYVHDHHVARLCTYTWREQGKPTLVQLMYDRISGRCDIVALDRTLSYDQSSKLAAHHSETWPSPLRLAAKILKCHWMFTIGSCWFADTNHNQVYSKNPVVGKSAETETKASPVIWLYEYNGWTRRLLLFAWPVTEAIQLKLLEWKVKLSDLCLKAHSNRRKHERGNPMVHGSTEFTCFGVTSIIQSAAAATQFKNDCPTYRLHLEMFATEQKLIQFCSHIAILPAASLVAQLQGGRLGDSKHIRDFQEMDQKQELPTVVVPILAPPEPLPREALLKQMTTWLAQEPDTRVNDWLTHLCRHQPLLFKRVQMAVHAMPTVVDQKTTQFVARPPASSSSSSSFVKYDYAPHAFDAPAPLIPLRLRQGMTRGDADNLEEALRMSPMQILALPPAVQEQLAKFRQQLTVV